jgi:hypothetical protein
MYGNILKGDTASQKRGGVGSMFLDLGVWVKPSEDFRLLAEFRMRNLIGLNLDQQQASQLAGNVLIDTRMIFRQVRAEGNIKKIIHYQIGDIDLGLTKYTLYNNDETYHEYESEIFKQRRHIAQYENFQTGNLWRLQGLTAKSRINFTGPLRRMDVSVFATRTRKNNAENQLPDRYFMGGKIEVMQSDYFTLGANWANLFDVPGTNLDTLINYNNHVLSVNYKITPYNKGKFEFNIIGENGISKNKYFIETLDTTSRKNDFFIDAGIRAQYKPKKIELTASYINVGADFTSPGAQTLRLRPFEMPFVLPYVQNNTAYRIPTIYDRNTDEFVYNQRIHTGLMQFHPVFGNVLPYGSATPNRAGLVFNIGRPIEKENTISFTVGGAKLSEIVSEGDTFGEEKRQFLQLKGGFAFRVSNLVDFKKNILISAGGRYESTERKGTASVNLNTMLYDLALEAEVVKGISILGGIKSLQGKGKEVVTFRDGFGSIAGYASLEGDVNQTIFSGGLKLALYENSFASVQYNRFMYSLPYDGAMNYSLGNLFINFTLRY